MTHPVGIIGGTGLTRLPGLEITGRESLETPWGGPSSQLVHGDLGGREVVFLARHGDPHRIPPHQVNYRANLWGLKSLGVEWAVSVTAVGSLQPHLVPGDMALVNQYINRTFKR